MNMLKQAREGFKAKTAHMTKKEILVDYIWEYYKVHILVAIIALYFLFDGINSAFINPALKPFAAIAFYEEYIASETADTIETELTKTLVPPDLQKRQGILCYDFAINVENTQLASANQMKFVAMLSSHDLDIVICDRASIDVMIRDGVTEDLRTVFTEEDLAELADSLVTVSGTTADESEGKTEIIAAVNLTNLGANVLEPLGYSCWNKFIALLPDSSRSDNAEKTLRYLLGL